MTRPGVTVHASGPQQHRKAGALPILHGDGIHDDTAAIKALCSGEPVRDARTLEVLGAETDSKGAVWVRIPAGTYQIGENAPLISLGDCPA